jgi:hypothetical protein
LTIALWGALATAAEPCAQPAKPAEVASTLQEAMKSYAELEETAFQAATDRALHQVECLREPLPVDLSAQLHRVVGVRQLLIGDEPGGREALLSSVRLEPGFQLSAAIAPEGGSLDAAWKAAKAAGPAVRVPFSQPVTALVDGTQAVDRPQTGPYVLQVQEPGGAIAFSAWVKNGWPALPSELAPGAPAPAPVASTPAPAPAPAPVASSGGGGGGGGKGFLVSGLVTGGVAAGLYGGAVASRLAYENNPTQGTYTVTNGAWYGSIGTAVLSAGLLSIHVVTR